MARKVSVDTSEMKQCAKCKVTNTYIYRHHKGNDGYLGWFNRGIARNYKRFLECVDLCFDCHCEIHFHYDTVYMRVWFAKNARGATRLRKTLIQYCNDWLVGKGKALTVPNKYKRQFAKSLKDWEKELDREKSR